MTREEARISLAKLKRYISGGGVVDRKVNEAIDMAISVLRQPERKAGRWIPNSPVTMKCDQCGFVIKDWDWHRFNYCPNCGAETEGAES